MPGPSASSGSISESSAGVSAGIRRAHIQPDPQIQRGPRPIYQSASGLRLPHPESTLQHQKGEEKANRDTIRLKTPLTHCKQRTAPDSNRDTRGVFQISKTVDFNVGGRVHNAPALALDFETRTRVAARQEQAPGPKGEEKSNRDTIRLKTPLTRWKQRTAPDSNRDTRGVFQISKTADFVAGQVHNAPGLALGFGIPMRLAAQNPRPNRASASADRPLRPMPHPNQIENLLVNLTAWCILSGGCILRTCSAAPAANPTKRGTEER